MSALSRLRSLWTALRRRSEFESEMDEEFAFHREERARELMRRGVPRREAVRRARLEFGSEPHFKEEARAARGLRWFDELRGDLRYARRLLTRDPAFAAVAIVSLGLGVGASTAMYSVLDAVLLRPLPYPSPERLVQVGWLADGSEDLDVLSEADAEALAGAPAFAAFGVYARAQGGVTWMHEGEGERLEGSFVTPGLLAALATPPALGTSLPAGSDRAGEPRAVVLSHAFWRERLGSDSTVVGRVLTLDDQPYAVTGVMPKGFHIPGRPRDQVWPVLQTAPPEYRAPFWLRGVARLSAGVDPDLAGARLRAAESAVKERYPESPPRWRYAAVPLHGFLVADSRATVLLLFGGVVLLLLIATANVTNLLLARATARSSEFAVRTALGAGRARLGRQLLTETLVLALAGGMLGVGIAWAGVRALPALAPEGLTGLEAVRIDLGVLGFTLGTSLLAGALIGLLPALRLPHGAVGTLIRKGGRGGPMGPRDGDLRGLLVAAEFALATMVLVGAGLIGNSLLRLHRVDTGASADKVGVVRFSMSQARYETAEHVNAFVDRLLLEVRSAPGVEAAALGMAVPPRRLVMSNPYTPEGLVYAPDEDAPVAEELLVTPGYFDALGIRLRAGRDFTAFDRDSTPPVAIVNASLAARHFPDGEALGRWIQLGSPDPDAQRYEIVGVVDDVKYAGLETEREPTVYVPYAQNTWWRSMYLVVRGAGPVSAMRTAQAGVAGLDPMIPVQEAWTMEELESEAMATPRFRAVLLGSFALIALVLAAVGIHGVIAYTVSQRRREVGIRMALGAGPTNIRGMILRQGLRLAVIGTVVGLVVSLYASRFAAGLLFGVPSIDPLTYSVMALVLLAVASVAILGPALRASSTDPLNTIRTE